MVLFSPIHFNYTQEVSKNGLGWNMGIRETQRLATLEKIQKTVDQLVDEVGFDKMTIRQICGKAQITIGAFYHHFKSKDDLLYDRYTRSIFYYDNLNKKNLRTLPPIEALKSFAQNIITYTKTRVRAISIPYHKTLITEYQKWSQRQTDLSRTIILEHFQKGQAQGLIKTKFTAEELSYAYWSFLMGIRFTDCMEEGSPYLKYRSYDQIMDWLDSLRT
jgi:AcrR family transcriptional regulator